MGNQTSAQVSFRNLVNEIKYGADLSLKDSYEGHYSYAASQAMAAAGVAPFTRNSAPGYDAPTIGGDASSSSTGDAAAANKSKGSSNNTTAGAGPTAAAFFAPDRPIFKTIFTTKLSDEDMAAFFNHDDVRFLRRYRPNQLAAVLHKCMEQLHYFTRHAVRLSDPTAATNALRILANALPYLMEDTALHVAAPEPADYHSKQYTALDAMWRGGNDADGKKKKEEARNNKDVSAIEGEKKTAEEAVDGGGNDSFKSVFADAFFYNFFWRNWAFTGESAFDAATQRTVPLRTLVKPEDYSPAAIYAACPRLPPIGSGNTSVVAASAQQQQQPQEEPFVPFAHVLVRLFTDCCFVPHFTLNGEQSLAQRIVALGDARLVYRGVAATAGGSPMTTTAGALAAGGGTPFSYGAARDQQQQLQSEAVLAPSQQAAMCHTRAFLGSRQAASITAARHGHPTSEGPSSSNPPAPEVPALFVCPTYMWYDGAFIEAESDRYACKLTTLSGGAAITNARILMLRCVLALFTERVVEGHEPVSAVAQRWRGCIEADGGIPHNTKAEAIAAAAKEAAASAASPSAYPPIRMPSAAISGDDEHANDEGEGSGADADNASDVFANAAKKDGSAYPPNEPASPTTAPPHANATAAAARAVPYLSDLFRDPITNPLGATLCASLFNYVAAYRTKGVLPWSSYIGADASEALLALAAQTLNAFLDFDSRSGGGIGHSTAPPSSAVVSSANASSDASAPFSAFAPSALSAATASAAGSPSVRIDVEVPFVGSGRTRIDPRDVNAMWAVAEAICLDLTGIIDASARALHEAATAKTAAARNNTASPVGDFATVGTLSDPLTVAAHYATLRPAASAVYRSQLIDAIVEVISNPLFASSRRLAGSQRRVLCHSEFLHLLLRLVLGAGANVGALLAALSASTTAAVTSNQKSGAFTGGFHVTNLALEAVASPLVAPRLVESLLFLLHNGTLHHKFFTEAQVVMLLLRALVEGDGVPLPSSSLSSSAVPPSPTPYRDSLSTASGCASATATHGRYPFVNRGNSSFVRNYLMRRRDGPSAYEANPQLVGLPPIAREGSINADLVALAMCSMLSDATPRWYLGLAPSAASLLNRLCGIVASMAEERHAYDARVALIAKRIAGGGVGSNGSDGTNSNASPIVVPSAAVNKNASPISPADAVLDGTDDDAPSPATRIRQNNGDEKASATAAASVMPPMMPAAPPHIPAAVLERSIARGGGSAGVSGAEGAAATAANTLYAPPSAANYALLGRGLCGVTLYELRHSFDFVTHKNFIKKGETSAHATQLVAEAVALLLTGGRLFGAGVSEAMASAINGGDGAPSSSPSQQQHPLLSVHASALALQRSANSGSEEAEGDATSPSASHFPDASYYESIAPLAAALGTSHAAANLAAYWYGAVGLTPSEGGGHHSGSSAAISINGGSASPAVALDRTPRTTDGAGGAVYAEEGGAEMHEEEGGSNSKSIGDAASSLSAPTLLPTGADAAAMYSGGNSRIVARTAAQRTIALASAEIVASLFVLTERVLRPAAEAAMAAAASASSPTSTAGRGEVVVSSASGMRSAFAAVAAALGDAFAAKSNDNSAAATPLRHLLLLVPPAPYANLLTVPIGQWLSKACWATTQQHGVGAAAAGRGGGAVLFDARTSYMFIASRRFYGEDVRAKVAQSRCAAAGETATQ